MTLVKQSQALKPVSYHKVYDILKQHQNEFNEIRAKRLARTANPLVFVSQQQQIYHPQNHPNHYTQNSSTRSQPAAIRNRGTQVMHQSEIQCYNYKEYGHVARECQKSKRAKDAAYHKENMLLIFSLSGGDKQETTFQLLKQKLCSAPILALPEGSEDFIVYYDASIKGLGALLMQKEKVIAYVLGINLHQELILP
ncbi:copia protein, partial [Tanacetum coccineum]